MREFHDIACEQQLLGAVLMHNSAFTVVDDIVRAEHFYEPLHAKIWEISSNLIRLGKVCNPVTIRQFLPADIKIGEMTLGQYTARLAAEATTIVNAPDFARVIRDLADRRLMIEVGLQLRDSLEVDNVKLASWAVEHLDGLVAAQSMNGAPALDMSQAVVRAVDAAAVAFQNDGKIRGLPYGLRALDDKTLGAKDGDLVVIAGRPGMGKTAFALSCLRNQAREGHRGMFVSLEMGDVDLTTRMIADHLWQPSRRLSYWQINSGKFREERFQDIRDAAIEMGNWPVRIEQQPGLTVAQIGSRARQYKRRHGLKSLWIDHLGLVKPSGRYAGNKVNETGEITGELKALAKELGVPVYLLCQLSRGVEGRDDKRPQLSDLRNSGDIEQDADTVILLYRPAYYEAKKEPPAGSGEFIEWSARMDSLNRRLDAIVDKQRSGPVGVVRLHCDIACNAVRDEISEMDDVMPISSTDAQALL